MDRMYDRSEHHEEGNDYAENLKREKPEIKKIIDASRAYIVIGFMDTEVDGEDSVVPVAYLAMPEAYRETAKIILTELIKGL